MAAVHTPGANERISIENAVSWVKENKASVWRVLGLVSSCGCFALTGSIYAFNAYANAVKESFYLTQTQVETIASLSNFGVNLGLPASLIQERIGTRGTLSMGIVIVVLFFMLLWSTQYNMHAYIQHSWLLYIYFFMTGFGAVSGYLAVYSVMMTNFTSQQRGRIVSLLEAFYSIGPAIFAAIYGAAFINGHVHDQGKQDVWGYFLFSAIAFLLVYSAALFLVKPVVCEDTVMSENSHLITAQASSVINDCEPPHETIPLKEDLTACSLFCNQDFHLLSWPFILSTSIQLMFINNIPAYLKSFHLVSYNTLLTVLVPIIAVVTKIIIGVLSDMTLMKVPRITYALVCNSLQTVFLFFCVFFSDNFFMLLFTAIAVGMCNGGVWTLSPVLVADMFGTRHFGRNWCCMLLGCCVVGFALQATYGAIYDANTDSDHNCYGKHCFVWSFVIAAILSFISTLLNVIHLIKSLKPRVCYNQLDEK